MDFLISILGFLIMMTVIVVIHELGHFLAAKTFGVYAHEFSIGMGPALYQRQGKETLFSIRALPIGGYVTMAGESDEDPDFRDLDGNSISVPPEKSLTAKPKWQQVIIMGAGVFMNFVLALVLLIGLAAWQGYTVIPPAPLVYEVLEDTPAARAGLQKGDEIVKVTASDGTVLEPKLNEEISTFVQFNPGESVFTVKRGDELVDLRLTPVKLENSQVYYMGYKVLAQTQPLSFWEAIVQGVKDTGYAAGAIFLGLAQIFQGKGTESLSGPVGIYKVTDQIIRLGIASYLELIALLSVNIGIFNLLPLPVLDGGRIFLITLESIFRRKISSKIITAVMMASIAALIALMLFATWNDIINYFL